MLERNKKKQYVGKKIFWKKTQPNLSHGLNDANIYLLPCLIKKV